MKMLSKLSAWWSARSLPFKKRVTFLLWALPTAVALILTDAFSLYPTVRAGMWGGIAIAGMIWWLTSRHCARPAITSKPLEMHYDTHLEMVFSSTCVDNLEKQRDVIELLVDMGGLVIAKADKTLCSVTELQSVLTKLDSAENSRNEAKKLWEGRQTQLNELLTDKIQLTTRVATLEQELQDARTATQTHFLNELSTTQNRLSTEAQKLREGALSTNEHTARVLAAANGALTSANALLERVPLVTSALAALGLVKDPAGMYHCEICGQPTGMLIRLYDKTWAVPGATPEQLAKENPYCCQGCVDKLKATKKPGKP